MLLDPLSGQGSSDIFFRLKNRPSSSEISVNQNKDIYRLLIKQIYINKKQNSIPGYRVRVFSDLTETAKNEALDVKAKIYKLYGEDIPVYITYSDPYYKVYVGDFKSKNKAVLFLN